MGEDGIPRLRNADGFCVFFDRARGRCSVYQARPLGCVIYPVNITEDGELIVDELCPEGHRMSDEEFSEKARRLQRLMVTIDTEAKERTSR